MAEAEVVQFAPWQSAAEPSFWERLAERKLHVARLSEAAWAVGGSYVPANHAEYSSPFYLAPDSLSLPERDLSGASPMQNATQSARFIAPGALHNLNTLENFKSLNRAGMLKEAAQQIWADIHSGRAEADPSLLLRFLLISFADLKKWAFHYWLAFPGLVLPEPAKAPPPQIAANIFSNTQVAAIQTECDTLRRGHPLKASSLPQEKGDNLSAVPYAFLLHVVSNESVSSHSLLEWEALQKEEGQVLLAFFDPCHLPTNPGWPLRNLLALAVARWRTLSLRVLCVRERRGRADLQHSLILDVSLPSLPEWASGHTCPDAVGWERNARGKYGPRFADVAPTMDPVRLATSAADLNLKLMRWRALPSLELQRLAESRCLILGAGTLGCQVARGLMAWGIRHITLLDYGRVAFSNPLRQSLFSLSDCLEGGHPKATAAATALSKIHPGVEAIGVKMAIPMPGHSVSPAELAGVREDCERLQQLVTSHDVIFLCTDTRESRWLPTLLCSAANKIAINSALGFDSYLVMRHGAAPTEGEALGEAVGEAVRETVGEAVGETVGETVGGAVGEAVGERRRRLGCYFCSDVVGPLDSTANRTLDQQCTVTRPGLAPIAAALAVELAVAILHHPRGIYAPADSALEVTEHVELPLGILPHQLRGFLSHFSQLVISGTAFDKCTACSLKVIEEFRRRGTDFLLQAFNEPSFLEDVTGLTEMKQSTSDVSFEWEED